MESDEELVISIGTSLLHLHLDSSCEPYYHFSMLIPTDSLENAMKYLVDRDISLLRNEGEVITHFEHGRSIYFYDKEDNILEFIERPLVRDIPTARDEGQFDFNDIAWINEIGLVCEEPAKYSHALVRQHKLAVMDIETFDNRFCWVGDHSSAIVVTPIGRSWLPTNRPAREMPLRVVIDGEQKVDYNW